MVIHPYWQTLNTITLSPESIKLPTALNLTLAVKIQFKNILGFTLHRLQPLVG